MTNIERNVLLVSRNDHTLLTKGVANSELVEDIRIPICYINNHDSCGANGIPNIFHDLPIPEYLPSVLSSQTQFLCRGYNRRFVYL